MRFLRLFGLSVLSAAFFFAGTMIFTSPQQVWMAASILHGSAEEEEAEYDLTIKDVSLRKITRQNSGEAEYIANLVLQNQGDDFGYNQVLLKIEPLDKIMVLSKADGNFYLENEEEFMLEESFSLPQNIAEQNVKFTVEPLSFSDQNLKNNSQTVVLKEDASAINNVEIENVTEAGEMILSWDSLKNTNGEIEYSILLAFSKEMLLSDGDYQEVDNSAYLYQKTPFSHKDFNKYQFIEKELTDHSFNLGWNPWQEEYYGVVVLKAENKATEGKFYSDLLYLQPMKQLSRAELAQLITDKLQLEVNENVVHFFEDVREDDWFAPYVKSLHGMGALDDEVNFRPNDTATRRELARMLSNIFQLPYQDLIGFNDIGEQDADYYVTGSMKKLVDIWAKRGNFLPDKPVFQETAEHVIAILKAKAEID